MPIAKMNLRTHYKNIFLVMIGIGFMPFNQAAILKCYNSTIENVQTTPLESPLPLIQNGSCIDVTKNTVLYVHGFNGNSNTSDTIAIITGYLTLGGYNVLFLDWAEEASQQNLGPALGYGRAVSNVDKVANELATALLTLNKTGLDLDKLHVVGFSLGAQLSGEMGTVINNGKDAVIARITGLDPAGPLYGGPTYFNNKLNMFCAKFVDALHTNANGYGIGQRVGKVDIWANYYPGIVVQPGCNEVNIRAPGCSHGRAIEYYRESILNSTAFACSGQDNYLTWLKNNGTTDQVTYLGEYTSQNATGNFYFVTNDESPYGRGKDGLAPNPLISVSSAK